MEFNPYFGTKNEIHVEFFHNTFSMNVFGRFLILHSLKNRSKILRNTWLEKQ